MVGYRLEAAEPALRPIALGDEPLERPLAASFGHDEGHQRPAVADRVDPVIEPREDELRPLV